MEEEFHQQDVLVQPVEQTQQPQKKQRKGIILGVCLIVLLSILCCFYLFFHSTSSLQSSQRSSPVSFEARHQVSSLWLHVLDGKLMDSENQEILLTGVNMPGMEFGSGNGSWKLPMPDPAKDASYKTTETIYDAITKANFTAVRIPISWANLESTMPKGFSKIWQGEPLVHTYDETYLSDLDYVIDQFTKRNIRVILSIHQNGWSPAFSWNHEGTCKKGTGFPLWLYPTACRKDSTLAQCTSIANAQQAFFQNTSHTQDLFFAMMDHLAAHYAKREELAVIGYDVLNEPSIDGKPLCGQTERELASDTLNADSFYQGVHRVLTKHYAPEHFPLFIFETFGRNSVYSQNAARLPQAVFSFHTYPDSQKEAERITSNAVSQARLWHVPLILGEFSDFDFTGMKKQQSRKVFTQWLQKSIVASDISWFYFAAASPNNNWKSPLFRYTKTTMQKQTPLIRLLFEYGTKQ